MLLIQQKGVQRVQQNQYSTGLYEKNSFSPLMVGQKQTCNIQLFANNLWGQINYNLAETLSYGEFHFYPLSLQGYAQRSVGTWR